MRQKLPLNYPTPEEQKEICLERKEEEKRGKMKAFSMYKQDNENKERQ